MKTIVITGATRGIGYGLAEEFLKSGHRVTINGRTNEGTAQAVEELQATIPGSELLGMAGDVRNFDNLSALWEAATGRWGAPDIWINNAGVAHPVRPAWELPVETARAVIETNIIGTFNGCKVAVPRMLELGRGAVYNMEGYGSRGSRRMGLALYGTSKAGTHFLSESMIDELKDTPVILGTLQPGMVATEMVTGQFEGREAEWERTKKILNIFVEPVEVVAPKLAARILANRKHGAVISVSSPFSVFLKFAMAPFRKRSVFD